MKNSQFEIQTAPNLSTDNANAMTPTDSNKPVPDASTTTTTTTTATPSDTAPTDASTTATTTDKPTTTQEDNAPATPSTPTDAISCKICTYYDVARLGLMGSLFILFLAMAYHSIKTAKLPKG
ncbi:hypothetical protein [Aureispira anguillae]|uniref:Uncharacterized protein n=1 Tax=Aureispira anguillae TaxID=2864201 RepID=A0A915YD43_9BACT|nr:hypothetical protein [Aureispira anguillae]BDS10867.1 hypothetical protein AsAng_0015770 [Aureispira anguillae]BDS10970.1 hypothetical protein AsAng_0016800 [Aureispira anguillae]